MQSTLKQALRVRRRSARAMVASTRGGRTLHRDAMQIRMIGISRIEPVRELGNDLWFNR